MDRRPGLVILFLALWPVLTAGGGGGDGDMFQGLEWICPVIGWALVVATAVIVPFALWTERWYRKNIGEVETSIDKGERVDDKKYEVYTKLMADRGLPAKPNAPPAAPPAPPTD